MTRTNILVLSVAAGTGHTRAAEALRSFASGSDDVAAVHLDMLQFVTPLLRRLYTDCYMFLVRQAPAAWGYLYRATDQAAPAGPVHRLRRWAERINSRGLLREIAQRRPDLIICTHFLPAEILSQLVASGAIDCPVWVQVTDFDLHRMWVHEHMAGYFAANEEVAFRLRALGIAADAIHVTGIPIMPAFSQPLERAACARELGIAPLATTVLLMGGGSGFGSVAAVAERLLAMPEHCQIIAMAGRDSAALAALRALAARYPGRLAPQGYTDRIERLMACADLVVTKPGGLTTAESLAMGLPMIVIAPIQGQEERNANFLLEQGVAFKAVDLASLEFRLRHLLAHPAKLDAMRVQAWTLGRPEAACRVLRTVLSPQESRP
ncbi:MAG: glycosyltransferase [Pseudomonadota bacterium]|nr:glycosyltransferase [Pseudomonadota bacterium]